ncbi:hypothetical protein [Thermococcus thioreducens]|uniref:Class III signal peptide n=1 Tax=Thermococcus thioreducens TaxID=277988 RepID=A0A0Q2MSB3_9EURY|nr:hypothetical protein [Thermococcus thioreducens]ASJ11639.1 hypothetical protein A3L14_01480 [Thermococcus thioreducens]KQH82623.1 hypothetical protein AMR53_04955 [Thermococcus thioreducens]SEW16465.1 hypothetical protein SAMN05216170_1986 [Thermococcus thioreducens]
MSPSRRKAQTAIEVLFITAIILAGILLVVPTYLDENTASSIISYIRGSASDACAYLNTGVIINESIYTPLNAIINASNYTYRAFQLAGVRTAEINGTIQVNVTITYTGAGLPESTVEANIKQYIEDDLISKTNVVKQNGKLYLGGREIEINVDVVRV